MRRHAALLLALSLTLGCNLGGPTRVASTAPSTKPKPAATKPGAGSDQLRLLDAKAAREAGKPLVTASLIGKIRLISDYGAGLIGNNGAAIVSNNGGRLIGKIRGEGAGLIGKIRYAVQQVTLAPEENYLADARVEVLDAEGRVLAGPDGKPIVAISDQEGGYKLKAELPDEGLILRVTLDPSLGPDGKGGALLAMLPKGGGQQELPIDTASSVGAGYVLERLVERRQAVYDRLPGAEAEALRGEVEAARGLLPVQPSYTREALAAAAEALQAKSPPVAARLERIRAILLAGQANLGAGRQATDVTLAGPIGVARDAGGNMFVLEAASFRVRKVDPQGRITVHAGTGSGKAKIAGDSIEPPGGMALAPDGTIYMTQTFTGKVRKIAPDGTVGLVPSPPMGRLNGIALMPDGALAIAELKGAVRGNGIDRGGGLFLLKDGATTQVPVAPGFGRSGFSNVACAPDGTLYAIATDSRSVFRKRPQDAVLAAWSGDIEVESISGMACDAQGRVFVADTKRHRVVRIDPEGTQTPVAGTGAVGHAGAGGPATDALISRPAGLWCPPEGGLLLTDCDGLVHRVLPDGKLETVAGTLSVRTGDATSLPINAPAGIAIDPENRLVLAETASSTLKRLNNGRIEIMAGVFGGSGYEGDGGPASTARLAAPSGIAYRGAELFVMDSGNFAIRRIDAAGTISTVVRRGKKAPHDLLEYDPLDIPMSTPISLTVSPRGEIYWADGTAGMIFRLRADFSRVDVVAGKYDQRGNDGLDGPARDSLISAPFGLTFGPDGDLYFCDGGSLTIRKIKGGEPTGTHTLVYGLPALAAVAKLLEVGGMPPEEGIPATEAALALPISLAFDADGALFVSELGTSLSAMGERPELAELLAELPPIGARIRQIKPDGTIRTIAGEGTKLLADPAGDDALLYPLVIAFDKEGRLVIADGALNQVKMLPKGAY